MRPDGPVRDLTDAQKLMANIAGMPADRVGLGAEYPKMVFRPGENPRHKLENRTIPMGNGPQAHADALTPGYSNEIAYVDDAADEAQALANGWFLSADPAIQKNEVAKRAAETAKDDEIANLRAQLAAQGDEQPKRGPGRPPKPIDAE